MVVPNGFGDFGLCDPDGDDLQTWRHLHKILLDRGFQVLVDLVEKVDVNLGKYK